MDSMDINGHRWTMDPETTMKGTRNREPKGPCHRQEVSASALKAVLERISDVNAWRPRAAQKLTWTALFQDQQLLKHVETSK